MMFNKTAASTIASSLVMGFQLDSVLQIRALWALPSATSQTVSLPTHLPHISEAYLQQCMRDSVKNFSEVKMDSTLPALSSSKQLIMAS